MRIVLAAILWVRGEDDGGDVSILTLDYGFAVAASVGVVYDSGEHGDPQELLI